MLRVGGSLVGYTAKTWFLSDEELEKYNEINDWFANVFRKWQTTELSKSAQP